MIDDDKDDKIKWLLWWLECVRRWRRTSWWWSQYKVVMRWTARFRVQASGMREHVDTCYRMTGERWWQIRQKIVNMMASTTKLTVGGVARACGIMNSVHWWYCGRGWPVVIKRGRRKWLLLWLTWGKSMYFDPSLSLIKFNPLTLVTGVQEPYA
jgi:hypothetical protein